MFKFIFGAVFGIIVGAAGAFYLSMQGGIGNTYMRPPPTPGQAVMHLSIDQGYLNQQLITALTGQTEFKGMQPTLATQAPNAVIVTADIEATVGGNSIKVRPAVTMQFYVEAGRIRTRVAGVNLGTVNVPADAGPNTDRLDRAHDGRAGQPHRNRRAGRHRAEDHQRQCGRLPGCWWT